jgi:hypothetical protein
MARFFKTISDLKKYLSVSPSFEIDEWETQETYSIDHYVVYWISAEQISDLESAYAAAPETPLPADSVPLIKLLQMAIANFTFYEHAPFAELQIDNSGIFRRENNNQKTAYSGQIENLKRKVLTTAFNSLEKALEYMESKPGVFTHWEDSEAYTRNRKFFINTSTEFNTCYDISLSRMVFRKFSSYMLAAELFEIEPCIGSAFTAYLKNKILERSELSDSEKNALQFIQFTVAYYTIAMAIKDGWAKYTVDGIVNIEMDANETSSKTTKTALPNSVAIKIKNAETTAERFKGKLLNYLKTNKDEFPTFRDDIEVNSETSDSTTGTPTGPRKSFFYTG